MTDAILAPHGNGTTLPEQIAALAIRHGNRPAILSPAAPPLSFAELAHQISALRTWLGEQGLGPEDRIAVPAPQGPATALAIIALASSAACIPINPRLSRAECLGLLRDGKATAFFDAGGVLDAGREAAAEMGLRILSMPFPFPPADAVSAPPAPQEAADGPRTVKADDPALIIGTSGSTGQAKIVAITHRQLLARAHKTIRFLGLSAHDRCLNVMPLCYQLGQNPGLFAPLLAGGSAICPAEFTERNFFEGLQALAASWYNAGPTHQQAILKWLRKAPERIARHRLRFARSGSAPLPLALREEIEALLGIPLIESYSSTETGPLTCNSPSGRRKPGKLGRGDEQDLAVVDQQGNRLPAGSLGEVIARGPCVIAGYENDPLANAQAFREGWFHTGDMGCFDEEGFLTLTGRIKDIINRGGEKIAPAEVDALLLAHPDVEEAVSFPTPHASLGEDIAAAIVARPGRSPTESALRDFLHGKLAVFKIPHRILRVGSIPRGPTGKPVRAQLAAHFKTALAPAGGPRTAATTSPLTGKLVQTWRDALGRDDIGPADDFFQHGGDSLAVVNLLVAVEQGLQVRLPPDMLARYPTPQRLADALQRQVSSGQGSVVSLHPHGREIPLFAISARHGHALWIILIGRELGPGQPFHALQPPGMDWDKAGCHDLPAMAAHYIGVMKALQAKGPYRLLGSSFGGLVAFEIALQLQAAGEQVDLLALLNSTPPSIFRGGRLEASTSTPLPECYDEVQNAVEAAGVRVARAHIKARNAYRLERAFDGEIVYFLCRGNASAPRRDRRRLWRHFATAGVRYLPLPGHHSEYNRAPQLPLLCQMLRACLQGSQPAGIAPARLFPARLRLAADAAGRACIEGLHQPAVAIDGLAQGALEALHVSESGLGLRGWALDPQTGGPAEALLVFLGSQLLGQGSCGDVREELASRRQDLSLRYAGFTFHLPLAGAAAALAAEALSIVVVSADGRTARLETAGAPAPALSCNPSPLQPSQ